MSTPVSTPVSTPATMSKRGTAAPPQASNSAAADLLRTSLRIDGWSTALFGVVLLAGGAWLSGPLGLPVTWSVPFGIAMLGGAAALGLIAGYPQVPTRLVATVVAGNALSCVLLLVLAFTDVLPLTGLGVAFLTVGAVVVAAFSGLEFVGLRRATVG